MHACPRCSSLMLRDEDGLYCVQCSRHIYDHAITLAEAQQELGGISRAPARMTGIYAGTLATVPRVPPSRSQVLRHNADYFREWRARKRASA